MFSGPFCETFVVWVEFPISLFHFPQWKIRFSQLIDKFLKF